MKMTAVNDYCCVLETDGKMARDRESEMFGESQT